MSDLLNEISQLINLGVNPNTAAEIVNAERERKARGTFVSSVSIAQTPAPIFPPVIPVGTLYILQVKMINIDGTKSGLTQERGFRGFVRRNCSEIGLSGFVWRIPRVHGRIIARGTDAQLRSLLEFLNDLIHHGFIEDFAIENNRQDFHIYSNSFTIMPSNRPRVVTGLYSDGDLDDVMSTRSADNAL
eukprot:gene15241-20543_t